MGCATTTPQARKMLRVPTLFGALHITVLHCHLEHNTNSFMVMDPYVKIIISNQPKSTTVKKKGGFDPRFDQDFVFNINCCYKPYGRSLQLFVLDQHLIGSDKLIGYGLLDLDYLIKKQNTGSDIKVRLNYECTDIGWASLKIRFQQLPNESLNFRMETLDITKSSFSGATQCFVKMTIGQQVFQTPKAKDSTESPPLWNDQSYLFEVPKCINTGVFQVFDDKKLIGKVDIDMDKLVQIVAQTACSEEIKDGDGNVTGILKFSVIKGVNAELSPDKTIYKRNINTKESKKQERYREEPKEEETKKQEMKQKLQTIQQKQAQSKVEPKIEQKQVPKVEEAQIKQIQ